MSDAARSRLWPALLLLAIFVVGGLTGAGLVRWLAPPPGAPAGPPDPLDDLDLTAEQRVQLERIHERHRPELDAVVRETFPRVRKVQDAIEAELRALLTPEQRARLDQLRATRPPPPPPGLPPHPPPPG